MGRPPEFSPLVFLAASNQSYDYLYIGRPDKNLSELIRDRGQTNADESEIEPDFSEGKARKELPKRA
jgi:hypothetical protein